LWLEDLEQSGGGLLGVEGLEVVVEAERDGFAGDGLEGGEDGRGGTLE